MMTESAFSIEELEELYCLFKVKELLASRQPESDVCKEQTRSSRYHLVTDKKALL